MRLKFLTLNIFKGNLLDNAARFLQEEKPDILTLQEVYNGKDPALEEKYRAFGLLGKRLGHAFSSFSPAFHDLTDNLRIDNGNVIFSRFPILSSGASFFDVSYGDYVDFKENYERCPRNLQHVSVQTPKGVVDVFNVHGIYGLDGKDNPRRLKMSRIIVDAVKEKDSVILAGDFNLPRNTRTIGAIEEHLHNVFGSDLMTSFNMQRKSNPDYGSVVVDMVFVTKNFRVSEWHCPSVDVSDHLPLVCVLER